MNLADDEFVSAKIEFDNRGYTSYRETSDNEFKNIIIWHFLGGDIDDCRDTEGYIDNSKVLLKLLENYPSPLRGWFSLFCNWIKNKINSLFKKQNKLTLEQKFLYIAMLQNSTLRNIKFVNSADELEKIGRETDKGVIGINDNDGMPLGIIPLTVTKISNAYLLESVYILDNENINGRFIQDLIDTFEEFLRDHEDYEKSDKIE